MYIQFAHLISTKANLVLILKSWQVKLYIGSHVANGAVGREGRDCRGTTRGDCVQMELTGATAGTQSW